MSTDAYIILTFAMALLALIVACSKPATIVERRIIVQPPLLPLDRPKSHALDRPKSHADIQLPIISREGDRRLT